MEILQTFPRVLCFPKSRIEENGGNLKQRSNGIVPLQIRSLTRNASGFKFEHVQTQTGSEWFGKALNTTKEILA